MIKVKTVKHHNLIEEIQIKGHANYEEYGRDIVCASVSSIVITTINGIIGIDQDSIDYQESDGLINIKILKHDNTIDSLINNMVNLLEELEQQYKKNIKINK